MFKLLSIAACLTLASAAIAQSNQPGRTTPSVSPSETPAVTPSQTPTVTVGEAAPAPVIEQRPVGGLSKCENVLAFEKEKCLQDERAGAGATGAQHTAPAGSGAPR
jgi:hypothetical protein